ncbi:hypothetical protein AMTR_s00019p00250630 [Amborella trichopoda]|uniref:SCP domain-containing protein n=2 Tax=Amborella trichopoda TaxID=13333 RepID=W1PBZ3_AMBTC|nr:hypothetical protein AMTR_s00019p00250630 [Amborella trichopoda]
MTIGLIASLFISLSRGYETSSDMVQHFLDSHNQARAKVGVPPLKWEPLLATYARVYSNQRRGDCQLIHSTSPYFGENIFWGQGSHWSARDAVEAWVREEQDYHYETNTCSGPDCTHYTQLVWRNTQMVGCAKIICNSGDTFVTCEYYPPGNYVGSRPY